MRVREDVSDVEVIDDPITGDRTVTVPSRAPLDRVFEAIQLVDLERSVANTRRYPILSQVQTRIHGYPRLLQEVREARWRARRLFLMALAPLLAAAYAAGRLA